MTYSQLSTLLLLLFCLSCAHKPKAAKNYQSGTDFHMHIHTSDGSDDMEFTAERALLATDSIGLKRALLLPNGYSQKANEFYTVQENNFVQAQAAKARTRLVGACAVNPLKAWAVKELKRCHSIGLSVLKLHAMASGLDLKKPTDYNLLKKFLEEAQALKFTVLVHANYPSSSRGNEIEKLKQLIEEFPDTRFIIGHLFGREFEMLKGLKHPNFLVETSVVPIWMRSPENQKKLVETMRAVGIERFVFGSDWPVFHPAETLKGLSGLPLTEAELEKVVYTNANLLNDLFLTR